MDTKKTILITGSSTGIGRACALYFDEMGFKVYAGVRKKEDGEELKTITSDRCCPILLDVTDSGSITSAVKTIKKETNGELFGLINNAGIGRSGALEIVPDEEVRKVMEVNVLGLINITKAVMPMIRSNKGRIINIGSSSGLLSFPGSSTYAASKFAVRAITDSLRLELKPFGVSVVLVAPGAVESEIWKKSKSYKLSLRETTSPEILKNYETLIRFGDKLLEKVKPIPAVEVAKSVGYALTSKRPKRCYLVGPDAKAVSLITKLPKAFTEFIIMKRIQKIGKEM